LPRIPYPWGGGFQITKFMVLELIAALLIIAIYVPLTRRITASHSPKGGWWNGFEMLLTFIRDFVAKPSLRAPDHGDEHHDEHGQARAHGPNTRGHPNSPRDPDGGVFLYAPSLWPFFFFFLFSNLLGMFPFMVSQTASPVVTGVLAVFSFILSHGAA